MELSLSPAIQLRLLREIRSLTATPPDGIRVLLKEDNITTILADIEGPVGTPFDGGLFRVRLALSQDFPASPPKGFFVTRIFHPNVGSIGEICVNTIKRDWNPNHGLQHILMVIRCLLIEPNPASALNEEAGKLLLENYGEYARRAALFTRIHARPRTTAVAVDVTSTPTAPIAGSSSSASLPSASTALVRAAPAKQSVMARGGSRLLNNKKSINRL